MAKSFKIIIETGLGYGLLRPREVLVVDRCAIRNTSRHLKLHRKVDRMTPAFPKRFCTIERAECGAYILRFIDQRIFPKA
jgi:hypothetical protein